LQGSSQLVFLTGASGFIGRRLASSLLKQKYTVRALVRPGTAPDSRIPAGCEQFEAGLSDVERLQHALKGVKAVIYCAGTVRGRTLEDFAAANIQGVEALSAALQASDSNPAMLLLSSLAASKPTVSDYALSKHQGEQVLRRNSKLAWTILRPPAVYGPGDREMLPVLKWIRRGMLVHAGPRDQRLSLLHVDDLVSAVSAWLATPESCLHQCYAIDDGTEEGYDWQAIGEAVSGRALAAFKLPESLLKMAAFINLQFSRLLGYHPMLSPGKARELVEDQWLCDNGEFSQATGWRPELKLREGARRLFET
jgi:nucleoside-diphosphate-sugar epimerase